MHIGIIMDGNGRWAEKLNRPRAFGHNAGAKALCRAINDIINNEYIDCATFYAFSTENLNRNSAEVSTILDVIVGFLSKDIADLAKNLSFNVRFIGNMGVLPAAVSDTAAKLLSNNDENNKKTIAFAIGYGGIEEVVQAFNAILAAKIDKGDLAPITEKELKNNLYTAGLPDPDLILRYGGYKRLSNFLPLQSVYSELFFTDKYWPDYEKSDLDGVIAEFFRIKRNFGGLHG